MSAPATGLCQVPVAVVIMVGSVAAPLPAGRIGPGRALLVALGLLLAGLLWLVLSPTGDGFSVHLPGSFVLIGGGLGLGIVTAITVAVRECADGESGLLSGMINAEQQLGGANGLVAPAVSLLPTADPR